MSNIVFLISQPRSGSTLLQIMLGQHPDIFTTSEPWINLHFLNSLNSRNLYAPYDSELCGRATGEFLRLAGIPQDDYLKSIGRFLGSLYQQGLENSGKKVFLDKTPRYYEILDELAQAYPDAKFILLFRDPCDVLNSIYKSWVKESTLFLSCYARDLFVAPPKMTEFREKYPDRCLSVYYEKLIDDPERELGEICRYIDLPFLSDIIHYAETPDWRFGDKNVSGFNRPTRVKDKSPAFEKIPVFQKLYLQKLGRTQYEKFGFSYDEKSAELEGVKVKTGHRREFDFLLAGYTYPPTRKSIKTIYDQKKFTFVKAFMLKKLLNSKFFLQ